MSLDSDAQWADVAHAGRTAKPETPADPAATTRDSAHVELSDPTAISISKELKRAIKAGEIKTRLDFIEIDVGGDSANRVANILAAIQRGLDERSWPAAIGDKGAILLGEERIELLLAEGTERVPHIPTRAEIRDRQLYRTWIPEHDIIRSSRLQLSITNAAYLGVRQKWADGKRQRVEDVLDVFVDGIEAAAESLRKRRLEQEERRRRWEEEERQRQERERRETIERVRGAALRKQAAAHAEAEGLRAYIEAVKAGIGENAESEAAVREWVSWAEAHVARLDPLSHGFPVLLSDEEALRLRWQYLNR